jgi:hypothetical protein
VRGVTHKLCTVLLLLLKTYGCGVLVCIHINLSAVGERLCRGTPGPY